MLAIANHELIRGRTLPYAADSGKYSTTQLLCTGKPWSSKFGFCQQRLITVDVPVAPTLASWCDSVPPYYNYCCSRLSYAVPTALTTILEMGYCKLVGCGVEDAFGVDTCS